MVFKATTVRLSKVQEQQQLPQALPARSIRSLVLLRRSLSYRRSEKSQLLSKIQRTKAKAAASAVAAGSLLAVVRGLHPVSKRIKKMRLKTLPEPLEDLENAKMQIQLLLELPQILRVRAMILQVTIIPRTFCYSFFPSLLLPLQLCYYPLLLFVIILSFCQMNCRACYQGRALVSVCLPFGSDTIKWDGGNKQTEGTLFLDYLFR